MKTNLTRLKTLTVVLLALLFVSHLSPHAAAQSPGFATSVNSMRYASAAPVRPYLNYNGRYAAAPAGTPLTVARVVAAVNELQGKPYVWGGGHRYLQDNGYDCSGSVSYALFKAGLLRGPLTSKGFRNYGAPGPGRFITLYVSNDHVFMSLCGLRFDTSDHGANRGGGPKWRPTARGISGFEVRHIPGL
ncbi:MAG: peptidoglycan endopeptidase [Roseimicrobium sp.]